MNKRIWLVLLFMVLFMNACGGAKTPLEPVLSPPAISVQITKDYCPSIEVQAGMQIEWTNTDNEDRVLLLERKDDQGVLIESGGTDLLQPGASFSITLIDQGQYVYYCSEDHTAFGTITVLP